MHKRKGFLVRCCLTVCACIDEILMIFCMKHSCLDCGRRNYAKRNAWSSEEKDAAWTEAMTQNNLLTIFTNNRIGELHKIVQLNDQFSMIVKWLKLKPMQVLIDDDSHTKVSHIWICKGLYDHIIKFVEKILHIQIGEVMVREVSKR